MPKSETSSPENNRSASASLVQSSNGDQKNVDSEVKMVAGETKKEEEFEDDADEDEFDSTDSNDKRMKYALKRIGLTTALFINYVVSNIKLVVDYSGAAKNDRYVRMTLSYMIAPIFITSLINLAWYIDDDLKAKDEGKKRASRKTWWLRGICLVLQVGTTLRTVQSLIYGYKSKCTTGSEKRNNARKMKTLDIDATLLGSFCSFLQSVPQFALQLYVITEGPKELMKDGVFWQVWSMVSCIGMITWHAVSCDKVLGAQTSANESLSDWKRMALLLPWRFFSILSRMTVLALFSTLFPLYFGIGCVAHYCIMYFWIQRQKVSTSSGTRGEVFLFLVGGLIFIVTDLLVKYDRSFHKYLIYYSIMFLEGCVMMGVWFVCSPIDDIFRYALLIGVLSSFLMGLIFLRLFYALTHSSSSKCLCCSC